MKPFMRLIKRTMVAGTALNGLMSKQHQKFKKILHSQIFHGWKMVMSAFLNLLPFWRYVKALKNFCWVFLFSILQENSISDKTWLIKKHGELIKVPIKSLMSVVDLSVSAMDSGKARRQPCVIQKVITQGFCHHFITKCIKMYHIMVFTY